MIYNKDSKIFIDICDKYNEGFPISFREFHELAYSNLIDLTWDEYEYCVNTLNAILTTHGEAWNERSECGDCDCGCDMSTAHYGFILADQLFVTGYDGSAGIYWNNNDCRTICKPY